MSALLDLVTAPTERPETFEGAAQTPSAYPSLISKVTAPEVGKFAEGPTFADVPAPGEAGGAGFTTSLKAGLVTDMPTKMKIYAGDMFPDDPNAMDRFGVIDGDIVYVDDAGKLQRVDAGLMSTAGSATSYAPEVAGGVVGSFSPAPFITAPLFASGGLALKKIVGNLLFDEPQTALGNVKDIAFEGAIELAGAGIGKAAVKYGERRALPELAGIDDVATAERRAQIKTSTGIDLDLSQASGNPFMVALKRWVRNYPGQASELVRTNDALIAGQVDDAIEGVMTIVAKADDPASAGLKGINAAQHALTAAKAEVDEVAGPLYRAAFEAGEAVDPSPVIGTIDGLLKQAKGSRKVTLNKVKKLFNDADGNLDTSVEGLHQTKIAIDELLEGDARTSLGRFTKRDLRQIKSDLLDVMSPEGSLYEQGRAAFEKGMTEIVAPLEDSIVGIIAKLPTKNAAKTAGILFQGGRATPTSIAQAKIAFYKIGEGDAWNGLVRDWLAKNLDDAQRIVQSGEATNVAGKWFQKVAGRPEQQRALKNAFDKDAVKNLNVLLEALESVAKGSPADNSATAFNQLITQKMQGGGAPIVKAVRSPFDSFVGRADARFLDETANAVADAMTDPAKLKQLTKLRNMKPSKQRNRLLLAMLGVSSTAKASSGVLMPPPDQMPPLMQQTRQPSAQP